MSVIKITKNERKTFDTNIRQCLPIDTCPRVKRGVISMIINDGHRSVVGNTAFVFLPIITLLFRILVGAIGCRGKILAAALGSLHEEVVLFK